MTINFSVCSRGNYRGSSMQIRAAVAVLGATLLAACVIFGQTGERIALMSSGTEEYRWAPLQHVGCRSMAAGLRGGGLTRLPALAARAARTY